MPRLIIIAGPNGAGKTTFAREYLATEETEFAFVNADEIARTLSLRRGDPALDIQAGRLMLARIDELVDAGANFVVETTLATLMYARKIPRWRALGYDIHSSTYGLIQWRNPRLAFANGSKRAATASPKMRSSAASAGAPTISK